MILPAELERSAAERARTELEQVQAQTREALAVLEQVHAEVDAARRRLREEHASPVVAVNQPLAFGMPRTRMDAQAREQEAKESVRLNALRVSSRHEVLYAQLREANEKLVLAALSAQGLQATAEIERRRQTDLLALVAHELRHPLAPIRTAAAIMGRIPTDQPVLGRLQAVIEQQVVHMARLVGDLLDVSRVTTGKLRLDRRPVNLARLLEDALDACRPAMALRKQQLTVAPIPASLQMDGDAVRLVQIFSNILDNASKYTPEGGQVAVVAVVTDGAAAVTVTDSGIGITAEALPRVFEPFVRDRHATVFNSAGLGIGLTVVRELVQGHGGTVSASSAGAGRGSRVIVRLPLLEPGDEVVPAP